LGGIAGWPGPGVRLEGPALGKPSARLNSMVGYSEGSGSWGVGVAADGRASPGPRLDALAGSSGYRKMDGWLGGWLVEAAVVGGLGSREPDDAACWFGCEPADC
jgi:hypothetical protein